MAVAGLAPGYASNDPLLAVASEGDGVVRLPRVLQALPENVVVQAGMGWENHGKTIGKLWENGKTMGKTMGKWENHREIHGKIKV